MPALTRRRDPDARQETWRIYFGGVHVGTIAQCVGNPGAAPRWEWRCGFYPGSRPGECTNSTAATFGEARAAFEIAWRVFLSGHCLRDQALDYCAKGRWNVATSLSATSLATVLQMVASGYGATLVPEVAADVELRDDRVKLLRFAEPQPGRSIGLAWRRTSPRKVDFLALGQTVKNALSACARPQCIRDEPTDLRTEV